MRGNILSAKPDESYQNFTNAYFDLSGYLNTAKQTNLVSNDNDFVANFETGEVGKIIGGALVSKILDSPVFKPATDQDKQLTGTGIPGSTINTYVKGNLLGKQQ